VGEIFSFQFSVFYTFSSSCFADQAADHNLQRIVDIYDGSKDFVWRNDKNFLCLNYFRPVLGDISLKTTQKPQILKSKPNEQIGITSKQ